MFKTILSIKKMLEAHKYIFLNFIARDVGEVYENVFNLDSLLLKLKYAFRKICMTDDIKK